MRRRNRTRRIVSGCIVALSGAAANIVGVPLWKWAVIAVPLAVADGFRSEWRALDAAAEAERLRRALEQLEQWDMLTLNPDGTGAATADAPWARKLIEVALRPGGAT